MLTHSDCYTRQSSRVLAQRYYRHGESWILAILFQRYKDHIFHLCLSYLKHDKEAEDATMDIFAFLPHHLRKYEIHSFSSWISVFCRNHCYHRNAQYARRQKCYAGLPQIRGWEDNSWEEKYSLEKKLEKLRLGISLLNRQQRNCIHRFYHGRLSYKDIALDLGISPKEVKSHLQNGRRNLRKFMLDT